MVTITRRMAHQLRAVLRRAFNQARTGPVVGFIADKEGLTVRSAFGDAAVELRVPGARAEETVWLPFQALEDFEAKKGDPVQLTASDNGQVTAQWRDGNVPQIVQYDSAKPLDADKFPALPTDFSTNPPGLLQALHEASEVTDQGGPRYATHCLQLTPAGTIHATDGHQALIQSGFAFPWQEPLLIYASKLFHSPELPQDKPVSTGKSGDWVVFRVEPWTIYLGVNKTGRFPDMTRVVPDPANATARCLLSAGDRKFLGDTLPRLPGNDEQNSPVTLDVNGHVAIRAKAHDNAKPTEVVLTNSTSSGDAVRFNTSRLHLKRAMKLGIRELCLYGDNVALLGQGGNRQFVWMPLEPGAAIEPTEDAIRIESPKSDAPASTSPPSKPQTERKAKPVNETTTNTNGKAATNGQAKTDTGNRKASRRKAGQQDLLKLIDHAIKFRTALHDLLHESADLVKALKQHRRQSKAIQNALSTISQVKTLL